MAVLLVIVLTLRLLSHVLAASETAFLLLSSSTLSNYNEAEASCRQMGRQYGLPDDQFHREVLRNFLREAKVSTAWLSVTKKSYDSWYWVNGSKALSMMPVRTETTLDRCGGISLQERSIIPTACSDQRNGFVCELKDNQACPLQHYTQACINIGSKTYIVGCKVENWFRARTLCRRYGGDLAVIDNVDTLQRILTYITKGQYEEKCSWLFVGLSKEDWFIKHNMTLALPSFINWRSNEPHHDGTCAQIALTEGVYSWKTADCTNSSAITVCQDYSRKGGNMYMNVSVPLALGAKSTGLPQWIAAVVSIGCLLVGIIVGAVAFYLFCKSQRTNEKDISQGVEEAMPLHPQENINIIVGIFSDGLGKIDGVDCVNMSDTLIVDPKGQKVAENIRDEYFKMANTSLGNKMDSYERKVHPELTIRNMKIPENSNVLIESLQMLSKDDVGVVYLPGVSPPKDSEVIKQIHELRDRMVLVCAAERNKNEFPGCEVICIGFGQNNQISTGILDFLIQRDGDDGNEKGVECAIGLMAGLLFMAKKNGNDDYKHLRRTGNMRTFLINCTKDTGTMVRSGCHVLQMGSEGGSTLREECRKRLCEISKIKQEAPDPAAKTGIGAGLCPTCESIDRSITKMAPYEGDVINIVIAATPADPNNDVDGVEVREYSPSNPEIILEKIHDENNQGIVINIPVFDMDAPTSLLPANDGFATQMVMYISERLLHAFDAEKLKTISKTKIQITSVPIKFTEWEETTNWKLYSENLGNIIKIRPDIVYLSATGKVPEDGHKIKRKLAQLCSQSVVVTGSKTRDHAVCPLAYPGDSVISAGKRAGPCGSTLDFVSNSDVREKQQPASTDEAWISAADTVCTAAATLMKAKALRLPDEVSKRLTNTRRMRDVLIRMCSHYPAHTYNEGYGILQPHNLLADDEKFKQLVSAITGQNAPVSIWSGKNLD